MDKSRLVVELDNKDLGHRQSVGKSGLVAETIK